MGPEEFSERRINIASAFNGVGWIVGPLLGTAFILNGNGSDFDLAKPYIIVAAIVLAVTAVLAFIKLPEAAIEEEQARNAIEAGTETGSVWSHKLFVVALIAQFLYVGAQTGVGTFFINYALEADPSMSAKTAGVLLSVGCMGMFFVGRLLSSLFMRWMRPALLLSIFGTLAAVCMVLVMTIVGGAVFPIFMGLIGKNDISLGYFLPLFAFAFIALYGLAEFMCIYAVSGRVENDAKII